MLKNTSTTITYTVWNSLTGGLQMGDSANHSCSLSLNGGAFVTATNSPSEVGAGVYALVLTAAETNADLVTLSVTSSTTAVVIPPVQIVFHDSSAYKADVSGIPASVWSAATRTLSDPVSVSSASVSSIASAAASDVWSASSRTLSAPPEIASNSISAIVSSVWAANSRTLSAPVNVSTTSISAIQNGLATASALSTVDSVCNAIQAKTDLIPARPAAEGSAMTLTSLYDDLKTLSTSSIASAVLGFDISDVENTAPLFSLCTVILAQLQSAVNGTDWTIYRTDGTTQHAVRTLAVSSEAEPVTGVSGP